MDDCTHNEWEEKVKLAKREKKKMKIHLKNSTSIFHIRHPSFGIRGSYLDRQIPFCLSLQFPNVSVNKFFG